jgi:hypothetical protein
LKNEGALKLYAIDPRIDKSKATTKSVISLIQSEDFWAKLKQLKGLFEFIHEQQKMSESTHSTVRKVYPRWIVIQAHLEEYSDPKNFWGAKDIKKYLERNTHGWKSRSERQLQVYHYLAYLLDPENRTGWNCFTTANQELVSDFLTNYGRDEALDLFLDYIHQDGVFHPGNHCWKHTTNQKTFWRLCVSNISSVPRILLIFLSKLLIKTSPYLHYDSLILPLIPSHLNEPFPS